MEFTKGVSNPGVVVPGALVPGLFRSSCTVLCEISKRSKYVETLLHVEKLSIRQIDKNLYTRISCGVPCELSKLSKLMETKILVLEFPYRAYEVLKYLSINFLE